MACAYGEEGWVDRGEAGKTDRGGVVCWGGTTSVLATVCWLSVSVCLSRSLARSFSYGFYITLCILW